jgi:tRNA (guanine10-N2)-methyltransferase
MANQCQIKAGDFVFDPFVGSGSLAVAAAHFGAHIFGADLDARVLMGTAIGHRNYENKKLV